MRHPIAAFVLLAFAISYLIGWPFLAAFLAWAPAVPPPLRSYLSRTLVVYGPGLAALILARVRSGSPAGAAALLRRLRPARADVPWAAFVVVVTAIGAAVAFMLAGVTPDRLAFVVQSRFPLLLAHLGLQLIVVGVGEELGWRGWLLPALLERMSRLRAALAVAAVWGLWHAPLLFSSPTTAIMFLVGVAGLSVLFAWICIQGGGRVPVVVLAHACVNTPVFFWEEAGVAPGDPGDQVLKAWYILEAFYAAAALCLVAARWDWWISGGGRFPRRMRNSLSSTNAQPT